MAKTVRNFTLLPGRPDILERIVGLLHECQASGEPYDVKVKRHVGGPNQRQRRYYRAAVLPAIYASQDSYTQSEIHELMLLKFAPRVSMQYGDREIERLVRSGDMNKNQFSEFLGEVIRFAEDEGVFIPPPRREGFEQWVELE